MADPQAVFSVDVDTGESSSAADKLAASLNALREEMRADKDELAGMKKALSNLKAGGEAFKLEAQQMAASVKVKAERVALATRKYTDLGGKLKDINKIPPPKPIPPKVPAEASAMSQVLAELGTRVANTNTAVGSMVGGAMKLGSELGKVKLVAVAAAAALVAVGAAAAIFVKSMYNAALAAQDARRNEALHLEALTRRRHLYARVANDSKAMQADIDRVSASTSISRGEVVKLAEQLDTAGVRGSNFTKILEASAIKASALGSGAGSAFAGFATSVGLAGGSIDRATKDVKNRFGDIVTAKMKSLEVQTLKVKENFDSLFSGLDIEPLLDAKKGLNDMFSVATASGRAFRFMATTFLKPIIDAATVGLVVVRRFFKQMLIGGLELQQLYLIVRVAFHKMLPSPSTKSTMNELFTALKPGRVIVYLLAAAFTALAVSVIAATWPFMLGAAAVWGLFTVIEQVGDLIREIDWVELGTSIWRGLVDGLKAGWDAIKSVASDLATELQNAFKVALGIQSPSKVFAQLGLTLPQGLKQGIEQGTPDARKAAGNIVPPPIALPADATPKPAASGGGKGATINVGGITITVGAGAPTNAKEVGQAVRRELETVLAGLAEQIGVPRTAAGAGA
jgi:hypothetical protein